MLLNYYKNEGRGLVTRGNGIVWDSGVHNWRSAWNIIFPIRPNMVVFYDGGAGHSEIYHISAQGEFNRLYQYDGWRHNLTNFSLVGANLVRIDDAGGHSEVYSVDDNGVFHDH